MAAGGSSAAAAANVHGKHPLPDLLHGREQRVYGDCAYALQGKLIHAKAPAAVDMTNKTVRPGSPTQRVLRFTSGQDVASALHARAAIFVR